MAGYRQVGLLVVFLVSAWSYVVHASDGDTVAREAVNVSAIFFELYTRNNPTELQILELGDLTALQQSDYNAALPTKILAHGYNGNTSTFVDTTDAFLRKEDCNVILVDWTEVSSGFYTEYPTIIANIPLAAAHVGAFVDFLVENGTPISSFHLIGFSLGAHLVGGAGSAITRGLVPRITGLDPAAPLVNLTETDTRLDPSDGVFVDVIHTNSGSLLGGEVSILAPIGHADFYPNGGQQQPGCRSTDSSRDCNHSRSVVYFEESINSETGFLATSCDTQIDFEDGLCNGNSTALMGYPLQSTARGVYYLATNDVAPFALG